MLNMSSEGTLGLFHTVQGEGKYVGYPTIFLRLSGCNLRCAWKNPDGSITTCDTPHTSFNAETDNKREVSELINQAVAIDCKHVVVTGGEPYFQKEVVDLINGLHDAGKHVTVETNGSIYRESKADLQSISLKLKSSSAHPELGARHEKQRYKLDSLVKFVTESKDFQFKFVLNEESDITEIELVIEDIKRACGVDIGPNIWVMPQGIVTKQLDDKLLWMMGVCKEKNWHFSDRLHIRVWGHMKGV